MDEELERALEGLRMAGIDLARAVEALDYAWRQAKEPPTPSEPSTPSPSSSLNQNGSGLNASEVERAVITLVRLVQRVSGVSGRYTPFTLAVTEHEDGTSTWTLVTPTGVLQSPQKSGATTEAGRPGPAPEAAKGAER